MPTSRIRHTLVSLPGLALLVLAGPALFLGCGPSSQGPSTLPTASTSGQPTTPVTGTATSPAPLPGWTLTWHDEFDGPDGSVPDPTRWTYDLGGGGWGNGELESYTSRPANAKLAGGNLVITAAKENYTGADGIPCAYTSARLKTLGLFAQTCGRFEASIKLPAGQGLWPAFWMLGTDFPVTGWPSCGEVDIMENIGSRPATLYGSIHGPGFTGGSLSTAFNLPAGALADTFHVYALEWQPAQLDFYLDSTRYATYTPANLPAGAQWVFDQPFFLILNVAVGGSWPGAPDAATVFPQTMQVDYVRVYSR